MSVVEGDDPPRGSMPITRVRRVMMETTTFVGLHVHKATIAVAVARGGLRDAAEFLGTIENTPAALAKLMAKLGRKHGRLSFCYEAGPCGYGVHRQLLQAGHDCAVVAPALIPRRAGDRVKTDRRDGVRLARLHHAGELSAIWVPDAAHQAMRDSLPSTAKPWHASRCRGAVHPNSGGWRPGGFLGARGMRDSAGEESCPAAIRQRPSRRQPSGRSGHQEAARACPDGRRCSRTGVHKASGDPGVPQSAGLPNAGGIGCGPALSGSHNQERRLPSPRR